MALVSATPAAIELIRRLVDRHGPLMFHQSGGCCDGSSPMCFERGEFILGEQDLYLGDIGGQPFYIGAAQYKSWRHTKLEIDVVAGRGGMFSLEGPHGVRFHTRSTLMTDEELNWVTRFRPELLAGEPAAGALAKEV